MGAARWAGGRRALAVVACAAAVVTGGCGTADDGAGPERSGPPAEAAAGLQPAGTDLADGLVVPPGTQLAGAAFPTPGVDGPQGAAEGPATDGWRAHLVVEGDPFVAFDHLATQLRAGLEVPMPGTAASCVWAVDPALEASASTSEEALVRQMLVTGEAPPAGTRGVTCTAAAPGPRAGAVSGYGVRLWWMAGTAPTMEVERLASTSPAPPEPTGQGTSLLRQVDVRQAAGPEAVPSSAGWHLPPGEPRTAVRTGDPFGVEVNCFAAGRYERLRLPAGAVHVADVGTPTGMESVVAVEDPGAVVRELAMQIEGGSGAGAAAEELALADGGSVLRYAHSVDAGGGGCTVQSSADRAFLLISRHPD